jgi:hypothetical protein
MTMRNHILKISAVAVLTIASLLMQPGIALAQEGEAMTIRNGSEFDISQIFLSKVSHSTWEEDVLGLSVLRSGRSVDVTNIDPGFYDVKLVDEDGDVCILHRINLLRDRTWSINTEGLLDCEFR